MLLDFVDRVRATVDWEKMPGDPMYGGNEEHYRSVGASALKVILGSHLLANKADPTSILDFACATGRVTRWLRAAFPAADMDVVDLNADWMTWSANKFGAAGWLSSENLPAVNAPRQYDLIWCGSLVTHISAGETTLLVKKFHDWLAPAGIAVVTSHGRKFMSNLLAGTHQYFTNDRSGSDILYDLALNGYGYVPHPGQSHGISASTLEWLIRAVRDLDARIITVSENAWDGHQDVVAFQKN